MTREVHIIELVKLREDRSERRIRYCPEPEWRTLRDKPLPSRGYYIHLVPLFEGDWPDELPEAVWYEPGIGFTRSHASTTPVKVRRFYALSMPSNEDSSLTFPGDPES